MYRQLVLVFVLLFETYGYSNGGSSSAGGDGVRYQGRLYVLDFLEAGIQDDLHFGDVARVDPALTAAVADAIGIEYETSKYITAKLEQLFDRWPLYEVGYRQRIFGYNWVFQPFPLNPVDDDRTVYDFGEMVQLAVRPDNGHNIYFDRNLWDELSRPQRAGLIFHELVYSRLQASSRVVRQTTAFLLSRDFSQSSPDDALLGYLLTLGGHADSTLLRHRGANQFRDQVFITDENFSQHYVPSHPYTPSYVTSVDISSDDIVFALLWVTRGHRYSGPAVYGTQCTPADNDRSLCPDNLARTQIVPQGYSGNLMDDQRTLFRDSLNGRAGTGLIPYTRNFIFD